MIQCDMDPSTQKRAHYRRYEDRRVALLFTVYKALFDMDPGAKRDAVILDAISENFKVDRASFLILDNAAATAARVSVSVGDWAQGESGARISGKGFERVLGLYRNEAVALCLESVRKPEAFSLESWQSLWDECLGGSVRALLSMQMRPKRSPPRLIWLQQTLSSREWSSRDRELIEEIGELMVRAWDKDG